MAQSVLITGGTGLVGTQLTKTLQAQGYQVRHLSRNPKSGPVPAYAWNIAKGYIDPQAFENLDYIVHLAGAGVADKPWTAARKEVILKSRTQSTLLLGQYLKEQQVPLKAFISASAIGLYGMDTGSQLITEQSPTANDFLAQVVKEWEEAIDQVAAQGYRTAKIRIGIVLSPKGGALPAIAKPIKLYAGAALGTGQQYMSWIHIHDLARLFVQAIENPAYTQAYNAVAPHPATNAAFTKVLAKVLKKPLILPPVPGFAMRLLLGPRAQLVLGGSRVSCQKLQDQGFTFEYPDLAPALQNLYEAYA